jgi:hypothetical protein
MTTDLQAPTPDLVKAFDMTLERAAPLAVGAIATGGHRTSIAVTGGLFEGEGLRGQLVGGTELLLRRGDGIGVVEASYLIAFADGRVVRAFGTGYHIDEHDFRGMRLSLLFEAAEDGPFAPLATRAFVGEVIAGSESMTIYRIV